MGPKPKMSAAMAKLKRGFVPLQEVEKQEGSSRVRNTNVINNDKLEEYKNLLQNYDEHLKKTIENCSKNTKEIVGAKRTVKMI